MIRTRIAVARVANCQVGLKLGRTSILSGLQLDSEVMGPLQIHRQCEQKYKAGKESDYNREIVTCAPVRPVMGAYFHSVWLNDISQGQMQAARILKLDGIVFGALATTQATLRNAGGRESTGTNGAAAAQS